MAAIKLAGDKILEFYQKGLPRDAFVEDVFLKLMLAFMVDDDLLTDVEKLYKANIATNKTPGVDY